MIGTLFVTERIYDMHVKLSLQEIIGHGSARYPFYFANKERDLYVAYQSGTLPSTYGILEYVASGNMIIRERGKRLDLSEGNKLLLLLLLFNVFF